MKFQGNESQTLISWTLCSALIAEEVEGLLHNIFVLCLRRSCSPLFAPLHGSHPAAPGPGLPQEFGGWLVDSQKHPGVSN